MAQQLREHLLFFQRNQVRLPAPIARRSQPPMYSQSQGIPRPLLTPRVQQAHRAHAHGAHADTLTRKQIISSRKGTHVKSFHHIFPQRAFLKCHSHLLLLLETHLEAKSVLTRQ